MQVTTLKELAASGALKGKRVLIRSDLNAPRDEAGHIGKKLIAETVEQFNAAYMGGACSGYDVYCAICNSIFISEVNGGQGKALADLEEAISRCLTLRWSEYDIPGDLK